ncbi:CobW family GTP-binding protein [Pseudocolwellia sp. HL-MZ19]|uniref:CobW family GTP-binding protein n=1 Tax=Pseudocolwellia sp. HL-MZ19 TaxID=3400846 RepID=UPI003CEBBF62
MNNKKLSSIPTNIITGFLGAGKTSAILHLLKQKPENERWAILVNEFGEIGVDGSLLEAQTLNNKNVFIQEVSGGCMCCSSGITMPIALNKLLKVSKPDRLLIEPTGLGHPIEVLKVLSNQYYQDVLSLEKTITLVDARNLADKRYTEHVIFNQQLLIADTIVGSKTDLYRAEDKQALIDYGNTEAREFEDIVFIENGELPICLLAGKTQYTRQLNSQINQAKTHLHNHTNTHRSDHLAKDIVTTPLNDQSLNEKSLPESGVIKAINKGEGFQSIGWRFSANKIFDRAKLNNFIASLNVTRLKAVFITNEGNFAYNLTEIDLIAFKNDTESKINIGSKLTECDESRIEIICSKIDDIWQEKLLSCLSK